MAGTKIKTNHDQRKSPTKKKLYQNETIDQTNTLPNTKSKDNGYFYFNRVSRQNEWYTPADITALSINILNYALNDPDADKLSTFYKRQLITEDMATSLRRRCPELDADFKLAKDLIGCRIWSNALRRKWDPSTCLKFLPIYDEEYLKELQRQAAERIALQNSEPNKTVTVLIPKFVDEKEMKK